MMSTLSFIYNNSKACYSFFSPPLSFKPRFLAKSLLNIIFLFAWDETVKTYYETDTKAEIDLSSF